MSKQILKDDIIITEPNENELITTVEESELIKEMPESNEIVAYPKKYNDIFPTKEEIEKEIQEAIYPPDHIMHKYNNQRLEIGEHIKNPIKKLKEKMKIILKDLAD